ncbi:methyltransferase-like protein 4 isoform X2 [Dendronephthya gigantea]|uniref:methyltransferase-like protein 4 isoform X2 n=1 Tax=Dendronephthya gigantea TaxID=151771 RepID=UPI00106CAE53|nr:methyltransferase-like protein 4 isoform X2 [Dendronephthya gigantea]
MSVKFKCPLGYLVDHKQSITTSCGSLPFASVENIFNINKQYGQGKTKKHTINHFTTCSIDSPPNSRQRKKRKRKRSPNSGEIAAWEHHEQIRGKILSGIESLSKSEEWSNYFTLNAPPERDPNAENGCLQALFHYNDFNEAVSETVLNHHHSILFPAEDVSYNNSDVVNRLVTNGKDDSMLMSIGDAKYILPANSKFVLSDVSYFCKDFTKDTGNSKYNMIVIDPPWENKSAKRGSKYSFLPLWEIKRLPIPELACDKALVIVWVTNKQKYRRFVIDELFPSWSCKFIAEWYWVKVTRKGEMVFDLDSTHKKPYEPIIIGRFVISDSNNEPDCSEAEKQYNNKKEVNAKIDREISETRIDNDRIICSVPCSLHSRKPPLNDIFREYLPKDAACIELFARNLLPNWTSWGNESTVARRSC